MEMESVASGLSVKDKNLYCSISNVRGVNIPINFKLLMWFNKRTKFYK